MRPPVAAALVALLVLTACSGGSPAPTPTPSPTTAATPIPAPTPTSAPSPTAQGSSDVGSLRFDPGRAFAHVEALAVDIGSRPSGSEAEHQAALYLRDQLQGFGYDAQLQPFSYDVLVDASSSLEMLAPQPLSLAVYPFDPSADGVAEGQLVDAGHGQPQEFPADTAGKIALIRRGVLFFSDKVANAEAAGAVGVVVYNNAPGPFTGSLGGPSAIPAVSISQEDGRGLLVAGGHYDSVPAGPGANDNASGTATVVEMARVLAADREFDDVCFVLFGAEEVGLIGSARFVESLTPAEKEMLEAMLNFDMVGVGTRWFLIGSPSIVDLAAAEAGKRGLDYVVDTSSPVVSDHASFANAGVPAVFFHGFFAVIADDPRYHTAEDRAEHVQSTLMAEIGDLGLAVIDVLLSSR